MTDQIADWNRYLQQQLPQVAPREEELILTITVPLIGDQEVFRVGFDLKRPGRGKYVALSTGRALYPRDHPDAAARHMTYLIECCNQMLEPPAPEDHR